MSILLLSLFFVPESGIAAARCLTSGLSEEQQSAMVREMFEDELFSTSGEAAKCYLEEFPQGTAREEMFFLQAESLHKEGDRRGALRAYNELTKNFPDSKKYREKILFRKGVSLARTEHYSGAIQTLELLLRDYPETIYKDQAQYRLGYAASYRAELVRKTRGKKEALPEYQAAGEYFTSLDPAALTQEQQQEYRYLSGRSRWFQNQVVQAAEIWTPYLEQIKTGKPEQALKLKYLLATGFQKNKNYLEAERWFARLASEHPETKLAGTSAFLRAEMAYAAAAEKQEKMNPNSLSAKQTQTLVAHYRNYLTTKDQEYTALTHYRIGILQQTHQPQKSISAFKKYLAAAEVSGNTETADYVTEVHRRLGYLFIITKQPQKAVDIFEKYLLRKNAAESVEVRRRLGYLFIETKQPQKAVATFEKYLSELYAETDNASSAEVSGTAEVRQRLGYLYVETKQPALAIAAFEQTRQEPEYRNDLVLLQTLMVLYLQNGQQEKYEQLLREAKNNLQLGKAERHNFQLRLIYTYYEASLTQKQCGKLLKELEKNPQLLEKDKNSDSEERQHLLFMRGHCNFETKQWELARKDLRLIRNNGQYREQAVRMLLAAHQHLEDWKAITWELQAVYEIKSPTLSSEDFQLWIYAAHQRKDSYRFERTEIIYQRWQKAFPEDLRNVKRILDWARLTEQLKRTQQSIALYEKMLPLLDAQLPPASEPSADVQSEFPALETREQIVRKLADFYEKDKEKTKVLELYETHLMPYLRAEADKKNDNSDEIQNDYRNYALYLGRRCHQYLPERRCARLWLERADQGGVHEEELQARMEWSKIEEASGDSGKKSGGENPDNASGPYTDSEQLTSAIAILQPLLSRPLSAEWQVRIHFRLATLYLQKQQWKKAQNHFKKVSEIPEKSEPYKEEPYIRMLQTSRKQLEYIEKFLSGIQLSTLIKKEDWPGVASQVRAEVALGKRPLTQQNFNLLLTAETRQKNWQGVLSAYALLTKINPKQIAPDVSAQTIIALVHQAQAATKLENPQLALQFYRQILETKPRDEIERQQQKQARLFLSEENLQEALKQKKWAHITRQIREEVRNEERVLDEQNFELLLLAEEQQKNWAGVLSAYALLRPHNPKRTDSVDALLHQAGVAEKLGDQKQTLKFYRQILKAEPLNQSDREKQAEVETFLSQSTLQKAIEQKKWDAVTKQIRQEVKNQKRQLDKENFELLLYAEKQKSGRKKWNGILDAYALSAKDNKKNTQTVDALIDQGYAAEKLGGYRRAKGYYEKALKKLPTKSEPYNVKRVLQIIGELRRLYERSKDYPALVRIYKRAHSKLKKLPRRKKEQRAYAYLIGYHQFANLKQIPKARIWLMRADGGGSTSQELQAAFWVAKIDIQAQKKDSALKRLRGLAKRKISKKSPLYAQIHFEIGTLYHFKEKWKSALSHYRLVANARVPSELSQLSQTAKQRAAEIDKYLQSLPESQ